MQNKNKWSWIFILIHVVIKLVCKMKSCCEWFMYEKQKGLKWKLWEFWNSPIKLEDRRPDCGAEQTHETSTKDIYWFFFKKIIIIPFWTLTSLFPHEIAQVCSIHMVYECSEAGKFCWPSFSLFHHYIELKQNLKFLWNFDIATSHCSTAFANSLPSGMVERTLLI